MLLCSEALRHAQMTQLSRVICSKSIMITNVTHLTHVICSKPIMISKIIPSNSCENIGESP